MGLIIFKERFKPVDEIKHTIPAVAKKFDGIYGYFWADYYGNVERYVTRSRKDFRRKVKSLKVVYNDVIAFYMSSKEELVASTPKKHWFPMMLRDFYSNLTLPSSMDYDAAILCDASATINPRRGGIVWPSHVEILQDIRAVYPTHTSLSDHVNILSNNSKVHSILGKAIIVRRFTVDIVKKDDFVRKGSFLYSHYVEVTGEKIQKNAMEEKIDENKSSLKANLLSMFKDDFITYFSTYKSRTYEITDVNTTTNRIAITSMDSVRSVVRMDIDIFLERYTLIRKPKLQEHNN